MNEQTNVFRKDEMRTELKTIKKRLDDEDRGRKAAVLGDVVEAAKGLLAANPTLPYLVAELQAYANNKVGQRVWTKRGLIQLLTHQRVPTLLRDDVSNKK